MTDDSNLSENSRSVILMNSEPDDESHPPKSGLTPVTNCCARLQCFTKLTPQVQEDCFNRFWSIPTRTMQNYFLAGLLSAYRPKSQVHEPKTKNKSFSWNYFVDVRGQKIQVCQNFLTGVYGLTQGRIVNIQHKLVSGSPLDDLRGKYPHKRKSGPENSKTSQKYQKKKKVKS